MPWRLSSEWSPPGTMWSTSTLRALPHLQIGSRARTLRRRRSQSGGSLERLVLPAHGTFGWSGHGRRCGQLGLPQALRALAMVRMALGFVADDAAIGP
jgi:hypothetical protein